MPSDDAAKSAYRAEIDGLRAFAILSVVIYHAFPKALTGGFIGVDVFFVISGYLITAHIFASLDAGNFSFPAFLGRRIRRLFPALVLVMATSLVFGSLALVADEFQQLGKHVASGAAFIVNFVLIGEAGYFDTVADKKPMLHLWSLAVEEQFYLVWPLVLWLAWKLRFNILGLTILVAIVSFYINLRFAVSKPTEVFFWPFSRFWELLSGSILAWLTLYRRAAMDQAKARIDRFLGRMVTPGNTPRTTAFTENAMAVSGLGLLIYGFAEINSDMPFPSTWALVPVTGAILVIAAGANAWSNRIFMMNPVAIWFGLISYPLYLWHWPLLSLLQIVEGGDTPHRDARTGAVILAIIFAWLTVRFVEKPLRFGRRNVRLKIIGLVSAMTCLGVTGLAISLSDFSETRGFEDLLIKRAGAEHYYGPSTKWVRGKDGWLFLGNEHNNTIAELKLAKRPDADAIAREVTLLANLAEAAAATDSPVALLIGPNKSTVYPEFLPDAIEPSDTRYVSFFIDQLRQVPNLTVIDPIDDMRRAKESTDLLYYRTDSHWNAKGAFRAFSTLADRMGWPVPDVSFGAGDPHAGDLISISELDDFPLSAGDNWQAEWAREPILEIKPLTNVPETSFGRSEIVVNTAPLSGQTVWVVGDSFTNALAPYFDATLSEVHYLGHWVSILEALPDLLQRADDKPDVIVVVRVERSF